MKIKYKRQTGIINIEKFRVNRITIVGCGAIGSFVAMSLAKMGLTKFTLYDHDKVEPHNLPNQFFGIKDIGLNKAECTAEYMKNFNNEVDIKINKKYNGEKFGCPIVISCPDKMEVRKQMFDVAKKEKGVQLFVDTRMGGLQGQIYVIDMTDKKDVEYYEATLFSSKEAVPIRCSERSILFTVLGIASFVCNQIVKAFKGEELKNYIVLDYSVPQLM